MGVSECVFDLLNGLSGRTELCEVISQIRLWLNIMITFGKAHTPDIFGSIFDGLWHYHSFVTVFLLFSIQQANLLEEISFFSILLFEVNVYPYFLNFLL